MKRRILAVLIACLMTFSVLGISAGAAGVSTFALVDPPSAPATSMWESENNNSITSADVVKSNQMGFGALETDYDHDFFRTYVEKPGLLHMSCQSSSVNLNINLLESDGTFLEWGRLHEIDSEYGVYTFELNMYIERPGNYYLEFADAVAPVDYNFYYCYRPYLDKYVDVQPGRYYYVPVQWADTLGITGGVDATHFNPGGQCTREQLVSFLWRNFGCPAHTMGRSPFRDVKPGTYYYDAVLWAVENGITSGLYPDTFGTGQPCTRAQMVTFLWNAYGKEDPGSPYGLFDDVSKDAYYFDAVQWAVENHIANGVGYLTFDPHGVCTRAHAVTFLYKAPVPGYG